MANGFFWLGRAMIVLLAITLASRYVHAACIPNQPDIAVYGVELSDSLSAVLQLGSSYELVETEDGLPYAVFTNTTETEVLKLYRHYGDTTPKFREAEVLATGDLDSDEEATVLDTPHFRTGRGVRLGMSRKEVDDRFGSCARTVVGAGPREIYRYEITDIATSDLLKAHNMPLYYAEYTFEQDKLVRFAFGFSYP
jgi:hypothetical protein